MAALSALNYFVDHRQERPKRASKVIALRGSEMRGSGDDTFVFPVCGALILRPSCFTDSWYTTNTGVTLKPTIASGYEVKTSAKWHEVELYVGAGKYLQCDDSSGEYARTSTAPGKNRGVYLSYFNYSGGDDAPILECGWSNSTSPSASGATLGMKIWGGRKVQIYENGTVTGTYTLPWGTQNETIDLVILPARTRELWVLNARGEGFIHVFDGIDEGSTSPEITPSGTKFFVVPGNTSNNLQIQFASLVFPSSGYALSDIYHFGIPPASDQAIKTFSNSLFPSVTNAFIHGVTSFSGTDSVSAVALRNSADSGSFTATGSATDARVKVTMTSDGSFTSFIDGVQVHYASLRTWTNAAEIVNITDYVTKNTARLSISDEGFGDRMEFSTFNSAAIGVSNLGANSFRPFQVKSGMVQIFDGVLRNPKYETTIREATDTLAFSGESIFSLLSNYIFRERVPFDGWDLCKPTLSQLSAMGFVLERTGVHPSRFRLSNVGYTIGSAGNQNPTEWNLAAEVGETALDVFQKLIALMSDAVYGSHPGPFGMEFWVLLPSDLPTEPVLTLYGDIETAQSANPTLTDEEATMLLYGNLTSESLPLEANEVRVMGLDARTGETFQRYALDLNSQDPELAPSARPANWAGMPLVMGVASKQIRSAGAAERLVEGLVPIVTDQPTIGEFTANTLLGYESSGGYVLPLWRMDLVRLDGVGTYRITALDSDLAIDYSGWAMRQARYSFGTIIGRGGSTVAQIREMARVRNQRRGRQDFGFRVTELSASNSSEVT